MNESSMYRNATAVAACLRALPPSSGLSVLTKVNLPEHLPSSCSYLAAKWKIDMLHIPASDFA